MEATLKQAIEDLGKSFEDFKTENDKRLKDLSAKGHTDPVLEDKVNKIAEDVSTLAALQAKIEAVEKAQALMQSDVPGGNGNGKAKPIYNNIGQQLIDVITVGTPNPSRSDLAAAAERLAKIEAAASGANKTVPSEGGYLVGTDEGNMLDRGTIATGLLSQRCFNVPCSDASDGLKLRLVDESSRANGSRFGGIQVYMKSEYDTVTASKPKFREAEWSLKDCMGIMYLTNDLLRDTSGDKLTAVVNKWFPMEFGFKVDDQIVNGVGAGQAIGIAGAPCTVSQAVETGQGTRSSNAQKVIYENIVNMYARLLSSSDASAVWFVNRALLPSIMLMSLPVGTGGVPVFLPPNGAAGQPYMTLLNKPIIPIEQCQAPGTAGDIILADLNEYLLLTKGGVEAAASIHVRFLYDEMTLRWVYRFDGAPLRNKTLTPFKGGATATQSPFITLAAS